jgi:hypothetical protein
MSTTKRIRDLVVGDSLLLNDAAWTVKHIAGWLPGCVRLVCAMTDGSNMLFYRRGTDLIKVVA